jgi:phenylpropionate dioxygenase-like ring-hydroxylating dioxygenase large terminal subunit
MSTASGIAQAEAVDGWWPAARTDDVTATPIEVTIDGRGWALYRPTEGAAVTAVEARCPHRLARLSHGKVVDGDIQCPYHGWRFNSDGACTLIPSNGPDQAIPSFAKALTPWGIREADGLVWIAPVEPGTAPLAPDTRGETNSLTNLDTSLEHGWHAVALTNEISDGGTYTARLLGRDYTISRTAEGYVSTGYPFAVAERFGTIWIAPQKPIRDLIEDADDANPLFAQGWLIPDISGSPAAVLAENFLDVAHFPFVHFGTFGAAEEPIVPRYDVELHADGGGLSSVQEQWFDNPEDPGVIAGIREVRQRRRATYTYRWPFQLTLQLEELDAGAVKTILFWLQPEDAASTRIYTKMLLHNIGGIATPGPDVVKNEVDFEVAVLAEDLVLQRAMSVPGLPLTASDEAHVRSDRNGVMLRSILDSHRSL